MTEHGLCGLPRPGRRKPNLVGRWAATFELAAAMADYIDNFCNTERRHSYLGNITPAEFETLWTSTYLIPQLAQLRLKTPGTDQFGGAGCSLTGS